MELPKQWLHWAQKAGIKPERTRGRYNEYHLVGRARHWRVNSSEEFECSCQLKHFDRWANSRGAVVNFVPKTEAEFIATVKLLHEQSKNAT